MVVGFFPSFSLNMFIRQNLHRRPTTMLHPSVPWTNNETTKHQRGHRPWPQHWTRWKRSAICSHSCGQDLRQYHSVVWYVHWTFTGQALEATDWYSTAVQISYSQPGSGKWQVLCSEWSCQSTESQLGLLKSNFHLSVFSSDRRVWLCFLVLKTHVSATWKTLLPIAAPMPPIKTSLPSSREFRHVTSQFDYRFIFIYFILDMLDEMKYMCAPWHLAISFKIGPWVCWAVEKKKASLESHHFAYRPHIRASSSELWPWNHLLCLLLQETISSNSELQFLTELRAPITQQYGQSESQVILPTLKTKPPSLLKPGNQCTLKPLDPV